MSEEFQKQMINRLMAVDCPNCGLERLSTEPYPAEVGKPVRVWCGGCGSSGERTMPADWQYTDINAWPLEQALNRRYPRGVKHDDAEAGTGQTLEW